LWSEDTFVDFEHGVTTAVKKLRQTLNDSAAKPRYVETLPKRGYRFIADVEFEEQAPLQRGVAETEQVETGIAETVATEAIAAASDATEPVRSEPKKAFRWTRFESPILRAAAFAIAGLMIVSILAFARLGEGDRAAPTVRRLAFVPESLSRFDPGATISPDGRYVAFVGDGPDFQLWVRALEDEEPTAIVESRDAAHPFWSRDSRHIGFVRNGRLYRVSPQGGAPIEICEMPAGSFSGGAWSPTGDRIVFSTGRPPELYGVSVKGGEPAPLFEPVSAGSGLGSGNRSPAFVVNSYRPNLLAFSTGRPQQRRLVVRDLDTGEEQVLELGDRPAHDTSGRLLYDRGGDIWAAPFSAKGLTFTGEARLVAQRALRASVSTNGTLVYTDDLRAHREQSLVWRDRKGQRVGASTWPLASRSYFSLARDGRSVALVAYESAGTKVSVLDLESGAERPVSVRSRAVSHPVWNPDSRTLAWRENLPEGALLRVDVPSKGGAAQDGFAAPAPGLKEVSSWTPDGSALLYSQADDLWLSRRRASGEWTAEPLIQRAGEQISARLSPDGKLLAYASDESGEFEVYVSRFASPADATRISSNGGIQPEWSLDGSELFYISRGSLMALPVGADGSIDSTQATVLFSDRLLTARNAARYLYAVGPEGRFLTIEQPDEERPRAIRVVDHWAEALWPTHR